ncbi:sedoheptulokinase-like isoform X2 [Daktulosphaira vitifoliae]|uniref:sedoheptulokinase-like isoform X2 n=1 Tax=Daktulosphaira vitifoliae TaxID=58002 RepID=UPI0021AA0E41|nr:sedoheptulokinase-like isoform X2 [Daktulosphaira vitifoliae]
MNTQKYVLGVDIGTSSVKICVVDYQTLKPVDFKSIPCLAKVSSNHPKGNEQNVITIFEAFVKCLSAFPENLLNQVYSIGVCGQMHGIVFWNEQFVSNFWNNGLKLKICNSVSNLYTWQDARVDLTFLKKLPKPESHLNIYSGYGCSTIFWLKENELDIFNQYTYCGTVQDLIVSILCNRKDSIMSTHNAASWGYFNVINGSWNKNILERVNFPVHFLPQVVPPGNIAGTLFKSLYGLQKGTMIGVALGDLQCSVLATSPIETDAVINISTSAQIAFITKHTEHVFGSIEYFPFFQNYFLVVAASLNGGNVLDIFVNSILNWIVSLGLSITKDLWSQLLKSSSEEYINTSLIVSPLMMAERHDPLTYGSLMNITSENLTINQMFTGICQGIVKNLYKMMPKEILIKENIQQIIGTGSVLTNNVVIKQEIQKLYELPLNIKVTGDAAFGAALSMMNEVLLVNIK